MQSNVAETSVAAYKKTNQSERQTQIIERLEYEGHQGATQQELADRLGVNQNQVSAAFRKLYEKDLIIRTTDTRLTKMGNSAYVYKLPHYTNERNARKEQPTSKTVEVTNKEGSTVKFVVRSAKTPVTEVIISDKTPLDFVLSALEEMLTPFGMTVKVEA